MSHSGSESGRSRLWAVAVALLVATVIIVAGWLGWRWFVDGFSGVHVSENPKAARSLAEGLGLQLGDGDRVLYGELQSSFPDSGSYLVVATKTPASRDRLLAQSSLTCTRPTGAAYVWTGRQRAVSDHGPGDSPTLVTCSSVIAGMGELNAVYDPGDTHHGTRVYINASQM